MLEDSVGENSSFEKQNDLLMSVESAPMFLRCLGEFKHHGQAGPSGSVAFGAAMPEANGCKRAFDRVGRP